MAWCLQCGSEGRPELAVGVDEDGEPACVFHRVKPNKVESEAPSPLQTTQKEADMGTKSQGVRPQSECKVCGKELATFMMERHMKAKHGGVEAGMQKAATPIYGGGRNRSRSDQGGLTAQAGRNRTGRADGSAAGLACIA